MGSIILYTLLHSNILKSPSHATLFVNKPKKNSYQHMENQHHYFRKNFPRKIVFEYEFSNMEWKQQIMLWENYLRWCCRDVSRKQHDSKDFPAGNLQFILSVTASQPANEPAVVNLAININIRTYTHTYQLLLNVFPI